MKTLVFNLVFLMQTVVLAQYEKIEKFYDSNTLVPQTTFTEALGRKNKWKSHGVQFDELFSIPAYSNKAGGDGKYQCTELVHRFLSGVYGVPTRIGIGMGNANVLIQNEYSRFGQQTYAYMGKQVVKMKLLKNGVSKEPPAPSSAINFEIGKAGHVAIVRYVEYVNESAVNVYLFEQHGYPTLKPGQDSPIHKIRFNKSNNGLWSGERVQGIGQPSYWLNFRLI